MMLEGQPKSIAEIALEQQLESEALRQREQRRIALRDQFVRLLDPFVPILLGALGFLVFLLIWEAIHRGIEQIPRLLLLLRPRSNSLQIRFIQTALMIRGSVGIFYRHCDGLAWALV